MEDGNRIEEIYTLRLNVYSCPWLEGNHFVGYDDWPKAVP